MKKISPREKNLLLILCGVFIMVVFYTCLFTPIQNIVNATEQNIETVERQIEELEIHSEHVATYQEKTEEYKENIAQKLSSLPADVKEEDMLAYLLNLENISGVDISAISFGDTQEIASFPGIAGNSIDAGIGNMQLYSKKATVSASLSYGALKNSIKYINYSPLLATLDTLSISFDSRTGNLNSSFDISRYYLYYPEAVYTPEKLPDVSIGVDALFGE